MVEALRANLPQGVLDVEISPAGGRDAAGRRLQPPPEGAHRASFSFWPANRTGILKLDVATGKITPLVMYPQPFQTLTLSPDGRRALLRRPVMTPGQSVGTTGRACRFDLATGRLERLGELSGLFWGEWSDDGGLLVRGGYEQEGDAAGGGAIRGQQVIWAPPGGSPRVVYRTGRNDYLADAHGSPDGKLAASARGVAGPPGPPATAPWPWKEPVCTGRTESWSRPMWDPVPPSAGCASAPTVGLLTCRYRPLGFSPDGNLLLGVGGEFD